MLRPMLAAGVLFLILAVITALFGFGVFSEETPLGPKLFSGFFLCAAVASFLWGWMMRARQPDEWRRGRTTPSQLASRAR